MKTLTLDDVLASGYCSNRYTPEIISRLWGDRETANALDVLDSRLPLDDKLWLIFKLNLLSEETVNTFRAALAHLCADIYERYYPDDDRVRKCAEALTNAANGDLSGMVSGYLAAYDAARRANPRNKPPAWAAARLSATMTNNPRWPMPGMHAAIHAGAFEDAANMLRDIVEVYGQ